MLVNIHFCESQVQLPNEIWWKFAKLIRSTRKKKKRLFPFETFNLVRNIIYFLTFSYVEKKFCICAQNGKMQFYYWWNSRSILDYYFELFPIDSLIGSQLDSLSWFDKRYWALIENQVQISKTIILVLCQAHDKRYTFLKFSKDFISTKTY